MTSHAHPPLTAAPDPESRADAPASLAMDAPNDNAGQPPQPQIAPSSSHEPGALDSNSNVALAFPSNAAAAFAQLPSATPTTTREDIAMLGLSSMMHYGAALPPLIDDFGYCVAPADGLPSAPLLEQPEEEEPVTAYARLDFPDGNFYINTYSVMLGRDNVGYRAALRRDAEEKVRKIKEESTPKDPMTPVGIKAEGSFYNKSAVSETGGIFRDGSADEVRGRRRKRKSKKSRSTGSDSQPGSPRNSVPKAAFDYQAHVQKNPEEDAAAPVDVRKLLPSPNDCPFIPVHPPNDSDSQTVKAYKQISREHMRIAYNDKTRLWEAHVIGRNGAFVNDNFTPYASIVELKSGFNLQMGSVQFTFILPLQGGAEDEDDEAIGGRYSEGGKEMSFDFEENHRDANFFKDTSEDLSEPEDMPVEEDDESVEDGDSQAEEDEQRPQSEVTHQQEDVVDHGNQPMAEVTKTVEPPDAPEPAPKPQKRRGPGRPPKNGIMSKREQREQRLAQKAEEEKANQNPDQPLPNGKNKVGRPRKHPVEEEPKREKRKYTKRKSKNADGENGGKGSGSEENKKKEKSARPARSPTPTFNEADLTPEQLAKPNLNYVQLIHDALSESTEGQLSLSQIYHAIQRKYPYFVVKCATTGWQSSVRHNLSSHEAFEKLAKDGKGYKWGIVPGVPIEKEKKRRNTPPSQMPPPYQNQPIYQAGSQMQNMVPGPNGRMVPGAPGPYQYPPHMPPHLRPGQGGVAHYGPPPPPGTNVPVNGAANPAIPPIQAPRPPGSYSSPYAKPPPSLAPPPTAPNSAPKPSAVQQPDRRPSGPVGPAQLPPQLPQASPQVPPQGPQRTPQPTPKPVPPPKPASASGFAPNAPNVQAVPASMDPQLINAIAAFRAVLVAGLKQERSDAEAIFESAYNRVLGKATRSSALPNQQEEKIMEHLRKMISQAEAQPPRPAAPPSAVPRPSQTPQPPSSTSSPMPTIQRPVMSTSIARPSFGSQGQHGNSSGHIARPTMAPLRPSSRSPAPPGAPPGISASNSLAKPVNGFNSPNPAAATSALQTANARPLNPGQNSGVATAGKRPAEDAVTMPAKRQATGGPVRVNNTAQSNAPALTPGKRPIEDSETRPAKRVATGGPAQSFNTTQSNAPVPAANGMAPSSLKT